MFQKLFAAFVCIILALSSRAEPLHVHQQEWTPDTHCITEAVFHESRGETIEGQAAVARVVMNRMQRPNLFGNTACKVVYQTGQFSWSRHEHLDLTRHGDDVEFMQLQDRVLLWQFEDATGIDFAPKTLYNATFFSRGRPRVHRLHWVATIGHHSFYSQG